jgi:hypothetical protein
VLELRLACLVISFPTRLRHLLSLPFTSFARQKSAANSVIPVQRTPPLSEGYASRRGLHRM